MEGGQGSGEILDVLSTDSFIQTNIRTQYWSCGQESYRRSSAQIVSNNQHRSDIDSGNAQFNLNGFVLPHTAQGRRGI